MIDSGANRNYASVLLEKTLSSLVKVKDEPYQLETADGSPMGNDNGWIRKEMRQVPFTIGQHHETITLDMVSIKYDVVLGMEWLHEHNPTIHWKTRTLEFPNCSHGNEKGERSTPKVPFTKAIMVRPQGRVLAEITTKLPSEYNEFKSLFKEREGKAALPEHKPWDHEIPIEEGRTPTHYGGLIPLSKKEEDFLKEYVENLLHKEFIRPSTSPISHGVLFAPKKDGGLRPCIDYRKLNAITKKNRYPLPRIDELQDRLVGAVWFTAIDVRDAYYRIRMKEGEEWKTAFRTRFGLYEYQVMPFGLTNAPASFQNLINDALREYLDDFALAYLDDILIFSKTYDEHVRHVKKVLERLRERDLPVKLDKCEFHKHKIAFLGYIVSTEGIGPDPAKIEAIKNWPTPVNLKEVQSFLGLANYYRKLIRGFSDHGMHLTDLTKKDVPFHFGEKEQQAFQRIKDMLCAEPILVIFDPEKEAILETDASDFAIGACLAQKGDDGKRRVVAYYSRKMTGPETNYDIHDKELLAVVEALRTWRVYLEGSKYPVKIYTDHKNLVYWTTTKELNRRQVRWSEVLASYNFTIEHVRGNENHCADALSRRSDYEEGSKPSPAAILKQQGSSLVFRKQETATLALMDDLHLTATQKAKIIQERHDQKLAGHPGVSKTIELITRDFKWPGMRKDVQRYVDNCDICKKAKHGRHKPYGLLQSPEVPNTTWESIAMDFIVKLPKSKDPLTGTEYDSIFVIIDRLSGYGHFVPYIEATDSEAMAYTILRTVFAQHGTPSEIISDRGTMFRSNFWQSLTDQLGIKHKLSTAFHPQTDGQTERTNQTLEQYLRCYTNYQQDNWVSLLPTAQFAYNNAPGPTGISPFYANYGKHPRIDRENRELRPIAEKAQIKVEEIKSLHEMLKEELQKIRQENAVRANKKRSEGPDFEEGEMVYLLRKNIKTKRPSDKLDHTKLGPYEIIEKLGPVTFRLKLPKRMRIHDVFHKSLLETAPVNAQPSYVEIDEEFEKQEYEVEEIRGHRKRGRGSQYLVKWADYDESENTWEPGGNLTPSLLRQYHQKQPKYHPSPPTRQKESRSYQDDRLSKTSTPPTPLPPREARLALPSHVSRYGRVTHPTRKSDPEAQHLRISTVRPLSETWPGPLEDGRFRIEASPERL